MTVPGVKMLRGRQLYVTGPVVERNLVTSADLWRLPSSVNHSVSLKMYEYTNSTSRSNGYTYDLVGVASALTTLVFMSNTAARRTLSRPSRP
jgi:hypothetical protein